MAASYVSRGSGIALTWGSLLAMELAPQEAASQPWAGAGNVALAWSWPLPQSLPCARVTTMAPGAGAVGKVPLAHRLSTSFPRPLPDTQPSLLIFVATQRRASMKPDIQKVRSRGLVSNLLGMGGGCCLVCPREENVSFWGRSTACLRSPLLSSTASASCSLPADRGCAGHSLLS